MENKMKILEKLIGEKCTNFYLLSKNNLTEEMLQCSNEIEVLKELLADIKNKGKIPELSSFNFRELRKNKGFTIEDVKLKTGILDSVISNIENNVVEKPSYNNIKLLLDLYFKNEF
jgi:hypothetical protein